MSNFSIKPDRSKKVIEDEAALVRELAAIEVQISAVRQGLYLGTSTARMRSRLGSIASRVSDERRAMKVMQRGLEDVNSAYIRTENKIIGKGEQKPEHSLSEILTGLTTFILFPQAGISALLMGNNPIIKNLLTSLYPDWPDKEENPFRKDGFDPSNSMIDKVHDSDLPDDNWFKDKADKIKEYEDAHKIDWMKGYYDENGQFHAESEDKDKYDELSSLNQEMTIASAGVEASGALWSMEGGISNGVASGSYEVDFGKAEAGASVYAGMYSYDADGNKHFTPGFGANVGVGVTAFSASTQGQIGDEYFNLHGEASVEVGHVGAEAGVNVGLFDQNGKLNPQASVSLSAEAIAAEVSGTVGTTIAGTSIDATGSVNFGVGAHADVGFRDGNLHVDIGASFGIGVSVNLDIDMSGTFNAIGETVNAVADTVSSAWTGFKGLFGM